MRDWASRDPDPRASASSRGRPVPRQRPPRHVRSQPVLPRGVCDEGQDLPLRHGRCELQRVRGGPGGDCACAALGLHEGGEVLLAPRRRVDERNLGHHARVLRRRRGLRPECDRSGPIRALRCPCAQHDGQRPGLPHTDHGDVPRGHELAGDLDGGLVLERGRHPALGRGLGRGVPREGFQRDPGPRPERAQGRAGRPQRRVRLGRVRIPGRPPGEAVGAGRAVEEGAGGDEALCQQQPGD
mmetsp:Transcript_61211/g.160913  ORF Transcript_61211/g.160913 Transcript_61211/m.160913 type:complete len:241 (-) Transcript_61211:1459-2181(-)